MSYALVLLGVGYRIRRLEIKYGGDLSCARSCARRLSATISVI